MAEGNDKVNFWHNSGYDETVFTRKELHKSDLTNPKMVRLQDSLARAATLVYQMQNSEAPTNLSKEQLNEWAISYMRDFEQQTWGMGGNGSAFVKKKIESASDEQKKAFRYIKDVYDLYDDVLGKQIVSSLKDITSVGTMLVSGGTSVIVRSGTKVTATVASRGTAALSTTDKLFDAGTKLSSALNKKSILTGTFTGAALEGGVTAIWDDKYRQGVSIDIGEQTERNYGRTITSATFGTLFGGVLGASAATTSDVAGMGFKKYRTGSMYDEVIEKAAKSTARAMPDYKPVNKEQITSAEAYVSKILGGKALETAEKRQALLIATADAHHGITPITIDNRVGELVKNKGRANATEADKLNITVEATRELMSEAHVARRAKFEEPEARKAWENYYIKYLTRPTVSEFRDAQLFRFPKISRPYTRPIIEQSDEFFKSSGVLKEIQELNRRVVTIANSGRSNADIKIEIQKEMTAFSSKNHDMLRNFEATMRGFKEQAGKLGNLSPNWSTPSVLLPKTFDEMQDGRFIGLNAQQKAALIAYFDDLEGLGKNLRLADFGDEGKHIALIDKSLPKTNMDHPQNFLDRTYYLACDAERRLTVTGDGLRKTSGSYTDPLELGKSKKHNKEQVYQALERSIDVGYYNKNRSAVPGGSDDPNNLEKTWEQIEQLYLTQFDKDGKINWSIPDENQIANWAKEFYSCNMGHEAIYAFKMLAARMGSADPGAQTFPAGFLDKLKTPVNNNPHYTKWIADIEEAISQKNLTSGDPAIGGRQALRYHSTKSFVYRDGSRYRNDKTNTDIFNPFSDYSNSMGKASGWNILNPEKWPLALPGKITLQYLTLRDPVQYAFHKFVLGADNGILKPRVGAKDEIPKWKYHWFDADWGWKKRKDAGYGLPRNVATTAWKQIYNRTLSPVVDGLDLTVGNAYRHLRGPAYHYLKWPVGILGGGGAVIHLGEEGIEYLNGEEYQFDGGSRMWSGLITATDATAGTVGRLGLKAPLYAAGLAGFDTEGMRGWIDDNVHLNAKKIQGTKIFGYTPLSDRFDTATKNGAIFAVPDTIINLGGRPYETAKPTTTKSGTTIKAGEPSGTAPVAPVAASIDNKSVIKFGTDVANLANEAAANSWDKTKQDSLQTLAGQLATLQETVKDANVSSHARAIVSEAEKTINGNLLSNAKTNNKPMTVTPFAEREKVRTGHTLGVLNGWHDSLINLQNNVALEGGWSEKRKKELAELQKVETVFGKNVSFLSPAQQKLHTDALNWQLVLSDAAKYNSAVRPNESLAATPIEYDENGAPGPRRAAPGSAPVPPGRSPVTPPGTTSTATVTPRVAPGATGTGTTADPASTPTIVTVIPGSTPAGTPADAPATAGTGTTGAGNSGAGNSGSSNFFMNPGENPWDATGRHISSGVDSFTSSMRISGDDVVTNGVNSTLGAVGSAAVGAGGWLKNTWGRLMNKPDGSGKALIREVGAGAVSLLGMAMIISPMLDKIGLGKIPLVGSLLKLGALICVFMMARKGFDSFMDKTPHATQGNTSGANFAPANLGGPTTTQPHAGGTPRTVSDNDDDLFVKDINFGSKDNKAFLQINVDNRKDNPNGFTSLGTANVSVIQALVAEGKLASDRIRHVPTRLLAEHHEALLNLKAEAVTHKMLEGEPGEAFALEIDGTKAGEPIYHIFRSKPGVTLEHMGMELN